MFEPTRLSDFRSGAFDAIIDVRSPAEFAEDHLPGAMNLPVLSNEERAEVGTIYKQDSRFKARKIGAGLVFRNAAEHLNTALSGFEGGWRPLVYCWRGGQRSGTFSWMLREIGWRADTLSGGYRTFRRMVVNALYDTDLAVPLIRLGGHTGTAKTEILNRLGDHGVQVIDLEDLARHRGSVLGDLDQPQPSQKAFESALAMALDRLDPSRPLVVEAESSKIGRIILPPALWSAMKDAPMIEVTAPLDARARYLAEAYESVLADGPALKGKLAPLHVHRGRALIEHWNSLIDADDRVALCRSLAEDHYDRAYDKSVRATNPRVIHTVETDALTPEAIDAVAVQVSKQVL